MKLALPVSILFGMYAILSAATASADLPQVQGAPVTPDTHQALKQFSASLRDLLATFPADVRNGRQPVSLIQAAQTRVIFGGIFQWSFQSASGNRGVVLTAVTPGGLFDSMGLVAGDIISAVNGKSLQNLGKGKNRAASIAARQLYSDLSQLQAGDRLTLVFISRQGQKTASASVTATHTPQVTVSIGTKALAERNSNCGEISSFNNAPFQHQIYPVNVLTIDGKQVVRYQIHRLQPGMHIINVAENIVNSRLNENSRNKYGRKDLTLIVEPGLSYHLAAQFFINKTARKNRGDYWQPVVFRTRRITCLTSPPPKGRGFPRSLIK